MKNRILNLEQQIKSLEEEKNSLQGECKLLKNQITNLEDSIAEHYYSKELYEKCTTFLNYVQKNSNELVKNSFESIVSEALQYIMGNGWGFKLEFKKRGNLGELYFNSCSIENPNPTPMDQNESGGAINIMSLALRIVILSLVTPKNRGFLVLDEPFQHLHGEEYLLQAYNFLQTINEKFSRQIICISDRHKTISNPNFNLIQIKGE